MNARHRDSVSGGAVEGKRARRENPPLTDG
jgi:hypothetical protein